MKEEIQNTLLDDFEVEIVDLDQVEGEGGRRKGIVISLTRRQRRFGNILTGLVYVLMLGLLLTTLPGIGPLAWHRFFQAHPSHSRPVQPVPLYLVGNPSWGHFTINGKLVARNPAIGQDQPLTLSPGTYTINWQVAPFQPQICTLQLTHASLPSSGNSCATRRTVFGAQHVKILVISFFASLQDLPRRERDRVMQQARAIIAERTEQATVQPEEWYALSPQEAAGQPGLCRTTVIGALCALQATQPLQATLHLQMDAEALPAGPCGIRSFCQRDSQDCRLFCEDPAVPLGASGWNVQVFVHGYWTYAPLHSQVPVQPRPLSFVSGAITSQLIPLYLSWEQHNWQVLPLDAPGLVDSPERNPVCLQAQNDLKLITTLDEQPVGLVHIVADNASSPADGCLVALTLGGNPGDVLTNQATAYCLERFGVLLAANGLAHRFWPYLPVANVREQLLAEFLEPPV